MKRTPRLPKYSLTISVITNTIGHSRVPAVKFSEPVWPNRFHSSGAMPRVASSAKILTPMNSASTAVTQKNAARKTYSRCGLSSCTGQAFENGILSGETAPPEIMKDMAWSAVQSVGIS